MANLLRLISCPSMFLTKPLLIQTGKTDTAGNKRWRPHRAERRRRPPAAALRHCWPQPDGTPPLAPSAHATCAWRRWSRPGTATAVHSQPAPRLPSWVGRRFAIWDVGNTFAAYGVVQFDSADTGCADARNVQPLCNRAGGWCYRWTRAFYGRWFVFGGFCFGVYGR